MKMVAFLSLCRVNQFVLWGKQTRQRGRQKKLEQSRARRQSTDQKRARALSTLSLLLLFSKQTSLSSTSLLLFRVGENNRVFTHKNKEEAKKLEHKSRGVKKHEHRNCSLNLRSFLSVLFSPCFFVQTLRLFHQCPWRSPQSLNEGPLFPTININTYLNKMAFTKAFYEQAFERNLKAQTTSSEPVTPAMQMTRTQRATAQFTAHSKKEVVSTLESSF